MKEAEPRAAELRFREYVLRHEEQIVHVLESSGRAEQRAMAADALGYAQPRQTAALVRAARDPDSGVRNNATRALGEILRADPSAAAQIAPEAFIELVRSGTWSDRNKGCLTLWPLTQSRDPQLLARIKSEAGDALWEIARWRNVGWAFCARVVLGRAAGIPEDRLNALASGPLDAFVAATRR
jgi:HEAT repeat protein